jgi:hypothetical protein
MPPRSGVAEPPVRGPTARPCARCLKVAVRLAIATSALALCQVDLTLSRPATAARQSSSTITGLRF